MTPPLACRYVHARSSAGGDARWGVVEETAVEIGFNGTAWTVMMATPSDLEDLAVGLAFTEGAILDASRIRHVQVDHYREGVTADIRVDDSALDRSALRRRTLAGVTGCGLCGVETLTDALRRPDRPEGSTTAPVVSSAVATALEALHDHQPLNRETRTAHAAAWCDAHGGIVLAREDVGRHNALDKLVGAMVRSGVEPMPGFIAMTSRCSFELVVKAARTSASALATISAPTGAALDLAGALGLALACRSPGGGITWFPVKGHVNEG